MFLVLCSSFFVSSILFFLTLALSEVLFSGSMFFSCPLRLVPCCSVLLVYALVLFSVLLFSLLSSTHLCSYCISFLLFKSLHPLRALPGSVWFYCCLLVVLLCSYTVYAPLSRQFSFCIFSFFSLIFILCICMFLDSLLWFCLSVFFTFVPIPCLFNATVSLLCVLFYAHIHFHMSGFVGWFNPFDY